MPTTRFVPWASGAVEIAIRKVTSPGSVGLAPANSLTKPPALRKQPDAGLGPVTLHPSISLPIRKLDPYTFFRVHVHVCEGALHRTDRRYRYAVRLAPIGSSPCLVSSFFAAVNSQCCHCCWYYTVMRNTSCVSPTKIHFLARVTHCPPGAPYVRKALGQ